ncbi:hypothetical protein CK203_007388 [Vitis vinifera]|uniref:Uncharacterized protein n=1 Tax=Vitis vinifera TaxID=29760 RepID=A0A438G0S9_VITVI|nr:hypothetical protein CK203_007388 [Vitis vinifera]
MNNQQGNRQCNRTRGTGGGMISSTLLPFRPNGTSRDDMTLFLAVVIELFGTISSNVTKIFTTKALDNTHVSTLIPPLCCISHKNRCTNISPMFHGSLSYDTLLLTQKFAQASIQRCSFIRPQIKNKVRFNRSKDPSHNPSILNFPLRQSLNITRKELEALRQRSDESVSSFISHWRGKITEIVDRSLERDKIQMILRSLQPRIARHVRPFGHHQSISQLARAYPSNSPHQYRPRAHSRPYDQTYSSPTLVIERPPTLYLRLRAPQASVRFVLRTPRQFSQLDMPLSKEPRWTSMGDFSRGIGMEETKLYNANLIKNIASGKGTPLMPIGNLHFHFV